MTRNKIMFNTIKQEIVIISNDSTIDSHDFDFITYDDEPLEKIVAEISAVMKKWTNEYIAELRFIWHDSEEKRINALTKFYTR